VTKRLQAFGMPVIAHDPYLTPEVADQLGVRAVDLETIFRESDYITLHVPKTKDTAGMIGAAQLASMKPGVRIVNVARGGLIDELALAEALKSGHVAGAAIDVYSKEPVPMDNPLLGLPNVVHTPHLGASTEEAQVNVAVDIAEQIVDVLAGNPARSAVNMPSVGADVLIKLQPFLKLAEKIGSLQAQLTKSTIQNVEISYAGDFGDLPTVHLTRAVLKGILTPLMQESVNYVNAPTLAGRRGISIIESKRPYTEDHGVMLSVRITTPHGTRVVSGTVFARNTVRIVNIDGYHVDIDPVGNMIVTKHIDRPGIIGQVGTMLGNSKINIAGMHVGREELGKHALMILLVDDQVPDEILTSIRSIEGLESAIQVTL
jgi:D-3-phosphoglycerate dehydrogenase